jgi:hypothetical protein
MGVVVVSMVGTAVMLSVGRRRVRVGVERRRRLIRGLVERGGGGVVFLRLCSLLVTTFSLMMNWSMPGTMEVAALAGLFYNRLLWIMKVAFFSFSRGYE